MNRPCPVGGGKEFPRRAPAAADRRRRRRVLPRARSGRDRGAGKGRAYRRGRAVRGVLRDQFSTFGAGVFLARAGTPCSGLVALAGSMGTVVRASVRHCASFRISSWTSAIRSAGRAARRVRSEARISCAACLETFPVITAVTSRAAQRWAHSPIWSAPSSGGGPRSMKIVGSRPRFRPAPRRAPPRLPGRFVFGLVTNASQIENPHFRFPFLRPRT